MDSSVVSSPERVFLFTTTAEFCFRLSVQSSHLSFAFRMKYDTDHDNSYSPLSILSDCPISSIILFFRTNIFQWSTRTHSANFTITHNSKIGILTESIDINGYWNSSRNRRCSIALCRTMCRLVWLFPNRFRKNTNIKQVNDIQGLQVSALFGNFGSTKPSVDSVNNVAASPSIYTEFFLYCIM